MRQQAQAQTITDLIDLGPGPAGTNVENSYGSGTATYAQGNEYVESSDEEGGGEYDEDEDSDEEAAYFGIGRGDAGNSTNPFSAPDGQRATGTTQASTPNTGPAAVPKQAGGDDLIDLFGPPPTQAAKGRAQPAD